MEPSVSFSLIVLFGTIFFIIITRSKSFKYFNKFNTNKKHPPQPWKLPIFGHIHHLIGALPHHALRKIAEKYGPVVHLQFGQVSNVLISSPHFAKEIMKTHDLSFANRPKLLTVEFIAYNYTDIAFSPYGDYWRQMRKICVLELLSAKKVQSFQSIREEMSQNLVEFITMHTSKTINLTKLISTMMNTIICRVVVGSKCKDQDILLALINEAVYLSSGFDVSDLFPSIKWLPRITGTRSKLMTIRNKLDKIFDQIISDHQERSDPDHENEDLLTVLLRVKDDGSLEFPLTFDNIKAVMLDMFAGGTDNSSATIQWAMSELLKNPKVMKKAQAEIRQVLKGKIKIQESDIQGLDYLKLVIKETLRLHPPIPLLLPRECREECEIGGYHIPIKTKVIINAWKIARDPDYWIDPESFIPERFNENSISMMGTDFEYLPFGAGRRMCPGALLGLANVELPLVMLLYHFNWQLPDGAPPGDLDMTESFGASLKRKNDLLVVPSP
ncbi:hypothetical protein M8C21_023101 [Ambrosia artemisiifolia]|uniref:Premnaspirodiene oxygenase-like n=1 Tax=Ambrosia artemisiifolia TaxID=4212 RepID=A0AAD5DBN1_AMBAR|nr:hypothetical protein M8C21_023101 [Ambrosia artemisiifolia]